MLTNGLRMLTVVLLAASLAACETVDNDGYYQDNSGADAALALGIGALAIGAIAASNSNHHHYHRRYDGYRGGGYEGYNGGYYRPPCDYC